MFIPEGSSIVNLIQLAVAPVFLLAGVAGLLNVFTGRLTRIVDKLENMDSYTNAQLKIDPNFVENEKRRDFLIKRMENINFAIFFSTATGLMVALVILTVFATTLFSFHTEFMISIFFILAMVFLALSLILFLREIYFTTSYIRLKKDHLE
jgi:uncharacterized protein YacL